MWLRMDLKEFKEVWYEMAHSLIYIDWEWFKTFLPQYSYRPFPIKSYLNIRKYKKSEHNKTELNRI